MGPDTHGKQRENRHPKCYGPKKSHGKISLSFFSAIACLPSKLSCQICHYRRTWRSATTGWREYHRVTGI